MRENHWKALNYDYIDEDSFCHIDAWAEGEEQGKTIALVDMLTGRVIYMDPAAIIDSPVQEAVKCLVEKTKKEHPYSINRLEGILTDVVSYECDEIGSGVNVEQNLYSMGFSDDEMVFFGFPPYI